MPLPTTGDFTSPQMAQRIVDEAIALAEGFRDAFTQAISEIVENAELLQLLQDIQNGQFVGLTPGVLDVIDSVEIDPDDMLRIQQEALVQAADITNQETGLAFQFDIINPRAAQAALNIGSYLVRYINESVRERLREIIAEQTSGLIGVAEARRMIRDRVGLLPQHAVAVQNYEAGLLATGIDPTRVQTLAARYSERLLRYRGEMISRTEVARATSVGQQEYWLQARDAGRLPPNTMRIWIVNIDELTCDICRPMQDSEPIGLEDYWTTVEGDTVYYPTQSHPNCRCTTGLVFPDLMNKVDPTGYERWVSKGGPGSGEKPGHDFRGNQYTGGIPGSRASGRSGRKKAPKPLVRSVVGPEGVEMQFSTPVAKFAELHGVEKDWSAVRAVSPSKREKTADAYEKMQSIDRSKEVLEAWDLVASVVDEQFETLTKDLGVKVQFVNDDPYSSYENMLSEFQRTNTLKVLRTSATGGHPYWENATNDKFRAVHDAFGHLGTGRGFDRHGEEAAFQAHRSMFPEAAWPALATELRGQNQYLLHTGDFGEQKIAFLPVELQKRLSRLLKRSARVTADDDNAYDKGGSHHVSCGRHFANIKKHTTPGHGPDDQKVHGKWARQGQLPGIDWDGFKISDIERLKRSIGLRPGQEIWQHPVMSKAFWRGEVPDDEWEAQSAVTEYIEGEWSMFGPARQIRDAAEKLLGLEEPGNFDPTLDPYQESGLDPAWGGGARRVSDEEAKVMALWFLDQSTQIEGKFYRGTEASVERMNLSEGDEFDVGLLSFTDSPHTAASFGTQTVFVVENPIGYRGERLDMAVRYTDADADEFYNVVRTHAERDDRQLLYDEKIFVVGEKVSEDAHPSLFYEAFDYDLPNLDKEHLITGSYRIASMERVNPNAGSLSEFYVTDRGEVPEVVSVVTLEPIDRDGDGIILEGTDEERFVGKAEKSRRPAWLRLFELSLGEMALASGAVEKHAEHDQKDHGKWAKGRSGKPLWEQVDDAWDAILKPSSRRDVEAAFPERFEQRYLAERGVKTKYLKIGETITRSEQTPDGRWQLYDITPWDTKNLGSPYAGDNRPAIQPGSRGHDMSNPNVRVEGSERPGDFVYRVMAESEYQQAMERGYFASDQRMNLGNEGTVFSKDKTGTFYWPKEEPARIVRFKYDPEIMYFDKADEYIKTGAHYVDTGEGGYNRIEVNPVIKPVPLDLVDEVSALLPSKNEIKADSDRRYELGKHANHNQKDHGKWATGRATPKRFDRFTEGGGQRPGKRLYKIDGVWHEDDVRIRFGDPTGGSRGLIDSYLTQADAEGIFYEEVRRYEEVLYDDFEQATQVIVDALNDVSPELRPKVIRIRGDVDGSGRSQLGDPPVGGAMYDPSKDEIVFHPAALGLTRDTLRYAPPQWGEVVSPGLDPASLRKLMIHELAHSIDWKIHQRTRVSGESSWYKQRNQLASDWFEASKDLLDPEGPTTWYLHLNFTEADRYGGANKPQELFAEWFANGFFSTPIPNSQMVDEVVNNLDLTNVLVPRDGDGDGLIFDGTGRERSA